RLEHASAMNDSDHVHFVKFDPIDDSVVAKKLVPTVSSTVGGFRNDFVSPRHRAKPKDQLLNFFHPALGSFPIVSGDVIKGKSNIGFCSRRNLNAIFFSHV